MAIGDITESIIDTLIIETGQGVYPQVLHISGNIYAVAYTGPGNDGWIKTFSCDSAGSLGAAVLAELEFDATQGTYPHLIHISGTTYAIAYTSETGYYSAPGIRTLTISDDGLTISLIDVWIPDSTNGSGRGCLTHVAGTVYAYSYHTHSSNHNGLLITLNIADNGTITKSAIDTLDIGTLSGDSVLFPHALFLKRAVGNYFLACGIWSDPAFAYTVEISDAGAIAAAPIDTYQFANDVSAISIIELDPGYYCAAYQGLPGSGGNITTFSVDSSGNISTEIDRQKYDVNGWDPMIVTLTETMRAIVYRGSYQTQGTIQTWEVSGEGVIAAAQQDRWAFDTSRGSTPYLIQVHGSIWMIVYQYVSGSAMKAITLNVSAPSVYPSDAGTRVSSIRHIFRPGMFRMQVGLGDIGMDIDIAEAVRRELEVYTGLPPVPPVVEPDEPTLTDYARWLSLRTEEQIIAIFGHFPISYSEWLAWILGGGG